MHEGAHHVDGPAECFGCKVKSISVNPYAMPTRLHHTVRKAPEPSWEKGVVRDNRGMPQLNEFGNPMGVKEYSERRHEVEASKRMFANANAH